MTRSEMIGLEMAIHRETESAILASPDGVETNAVWLPTSQIEIDPPKRCSDFTTVTMPLWLAEDKFLV